jgi:regulator of replication initiation timing
MKEPIVDKSEIYDQFARLTQQTKDLVESVEVLSDRMTKVLAENARLTIENEHLHEVIATKHEKKQEAGLSESRKMLQKLYQEGFHVCNDMYGKRLEPNESCTFCLDAIYGRQK